MDDTAASRWDRLQTYRQQYLRRAIDCSQLTIPSLIPESDLVSTRNPGQGDENLPSLFQGAGARGVSNLAAKLLLALYPPSQPFFRLTLDGAQVEQFAQQQGVVVDDDFISKVDEGLSRLERTILLRLEKMGARSVIFEALRHLVVGGNGLLFVDQDALRFYGLRSFCVDRDPEGNWREIVVKEEVAWDYIPESLRPDKMTEDEAIDEFAELYTHVLVDPDDNKAEWYQEVEGKRVPGTGGTSTIDACPWIPLRLHRVAGEAYGRGLVEEVLGDLQSLESLMQALVEGNLIMSKCIPLVNPNGVTKIRDIARAENGQPVAGNPNDVAMLALDKSREFGSALQSVQLIERRLQFAFMMQESIQRDAERVTAEEVRQMAEQLEQTLGGIYSLLAQEMQQPLIARTVNVMERNGEVRGMPSQFVSAEITTGLDSIGRGNDRARLMQFMQVVAGTLGPEVMQQFIKPAELIRRFAASDGIDTKGLVKTEEEMQQEQAQAQKLMLQQQLVEGQLRNGQPQPTPGAAQGAAPTGNGAQGPGGPGA